MFIYINTKEWAHMTLKFQTDAYRNLCDKRGLMSCGETSAHIFVNDLSLFMDKTLMFRSVQCSQFSKISLLTIDFHIISFRKYSSLLIIVVIYRKFSSSFSTKF